jgi:Chaperone of endosialidase/Secretion system C-terminal sorting domain
MIELKVFIIRFGFTFKTLHMKKITFLSFVGMVLVFSTKAQNNLGVLQSSLPGAPLISNGDISMTKTNPSILLAGDANSLNSEIRFTTLYPNVTGGFLGIYSPAYYGAGGLHLNTVTAANKRLGIGAFPTGNIATSSDPSIVTFRTTGSIGQTNDIFKVLRNTATQTGYLTEENAFLVDKNGQSNFGVTLPTNLHSLSFLPQHRVGIQGLLNQDGLLVRTQGGTTKKLYAGYFSNVQTGVSSQPGFGVYGESNSPNSGGSLTNYGGYFTSTSNAPNDLAIGVAGVAQSCGTAYGVYGKVSPFSLCPFNSPRWAGFFEGNVFATGVYSTSDARLKNSIKNEEGTVAKLLQLEPVSYYFDTKKQQELGLPNDLQHGLIAQKVQEIFPELVTNVIFPKSINADKGEKPLEYLAVNYTSMIPLLIQGLKEQQAEINELKELLKSKSGEIKVATKPSDKIVTSNGSFDTNEFKMLQNTPNPFSSETTIQYNLPKGVTNAKLVVFDLTGSLKMQFNNLSKNNKVIIRGNSLQAGMYIYSLVVDGNEVLSKKMILTK